MILEAVRPLVDAALEAIIFQLLWLKNPRYIGSVAPSSNYLASTIASQVALDCPGIVVELGGGTGSITRALLTRVAAPADLVVIEREPALCAQLVARFPGIRVICGDARDLRKLLNAADMGPVSAIVSSLPLLSLSRVTRGQVLEEAFAVLKGEGDFVQFTYGFLSPVGSSYARSAGIIGRRTGWVLRNLPPAIIWSYRRTRQAEEVKPSNDHAVVIA